MCSYEIGQTTLLSNRTLTSCTNQKCIQLKFLFLLLSRAKLFYSRTKANPSFLSFWTPLSDYPRSVCLQTTHQSEIHEESFLHAQTEVRIMGKKNFQISLLGINLQSVSLEQSLWILFPLPPPSPPTSNELTGAAPSSCSVLSLP